MKLVVVQRGKLRDAAVVSLRDERLSKATWVIDNSGDLNDLEVATMVVWEELVARRDDLAREAEVSAESR